MPCQDDRTGQEYSSQLLEELNKITALLCEQCKANDRLNFGLTENVGAWYNEHKNRDLERIKKITTALAKARARANVVSEHIDCFQPGVLTEIATEINRLEKELED